MLLLLFVMSLVMSLQSMLLLLPMMPLLIFSCTYSSWRCHSFCSRFGLSCCCNCYLALPSLPFRCCCCSCRYCCCKYCHHHSYCFRFCRRCCPSYSPSVLRQLRTNLDMFCHVKCQIVSGRGGGYFRQVRGTDVVIHVILF